MRALGPNRWRSPSASPAVPAPQRLKLDPKGFRTVGLDPGALLKNPVVKVEGQAGKTWLYKLELTAPRLDIAGTGAANGFKVRRVIKNTDGSDVIKVGDLVKVTVFMEVAGKGQRYVVLDDPLPAGLMALNTAFKTEEPIPEDESRSATTTSITSPRMGPSGSVPIISKSGTTGCWPSGTRFTPAPTGSSITAGPCARASLWLPPPGWRPCTRRE